MELNFVPSVFVPECMSNYMKTIAWDVDDVLNDLMMMWLKQKWIEEHKDCRLRYEGLIENPTHRLLGVGINEYLSSLDGYRLSALYQQMTPVKEIMEWFARCGNNFRHIALTAVPLVAASASAQWVFTHFGAWIRTFHFVPSKRAGQNIPDYDNDKSAFLKWLAKADVFIDDSPVNIKDAESAGIRSILWPRPWNDSKLTPVEALTSMEDFLNDGETA